MKAESNSYGPAEQIEIVRRQLVLGELGIEIPTDQHGDVDVQKLMEIKITSEQDQEVTAEKKRQATCLKNLKLNDSVLTMMESTFPIMQIKSNQINNIDLVDTQTFTKQLEKISDKKNVMTLFAETQKTKE